jgi:hypothetical protein
LLRAAVRRGAELADPISSARFGSGVAVVTRADWIERE